MTTAGQTKRKREESTILADSPNISGSFSGIEPQQKKKTRLRIVTELPGDLFKFDHPYVSPMPSIFDGIDSPSSLFSKDGDGDVEQNSLPLVTDVRANEWSDVAHPTGLARRTEPPIPGLFFASAIRLPEEIADEVMRKCMGAYFQTEGVNQVMLFGRSHGSGLPTFLTSLLSKLADLLRPILPPHTHDLLFPLSGTRARQAILNLYQPGEGISPHVDLLRRFADGILGVSLGSGCVMQFERQKEEGEEIPVERWDLFLPERSIIVFSEEARYKWTHGIDRRSEDFVEREGTEAGGEWIARGTRLSITFRWLLPGADIVGGLD